MRNDNSGTVAKAASDASDKRALYMKRRVKFVQEAQKLGEVLVVYVQSAANRADILTKPVSAKIFDARRDLECAAHSDEYPSVGISEGATVRRLHSAGASALIRDSSRAPMERSRGSILGRSPLVQTSIPELGFFCFLISSTT